MEKPSILEPSLIAKDIDRLRQELERQNSRCVALQRQLEIRDQQLELILNSRTWRLTGPARKLLGWIKRSPNYVRPRSKLYHKWLQKFERITPKLRQAMAECISTLPSRPLISVIMPSYDIDPKWISAAIESVRNQIYPHWELCISDDASTLAELRSLLEAYRSIDPRIRIVFRQENGHISANSNSALDLATGDYIALLDADDLLSEDALFWVAHEITMHPEVDLLFSDEDKIGTDGKAFDPFFKSAWNPAQMLSQNAFAHLGVYRRALVEEVGGFREGYEGAQDHDLVLRCFRRTTTDRIRHIPRILYHWRTLSKSTAAGLPAKPYAWEAGRMAIADHLNQLGIRGQVDRALECFYQVDYDMPQTVPMVSILMPSTLSTATAMRCLASVLTKSRYKNLELLLLTHSDHVKMAESNSKLVDLLADPRVRMIRYEKAPFNYSWVNNLGAGSARGEFLCFLNDDVEVITDDWLERLVARVTLDGVGAAGPMLYYPSNRIQHAGVILGLGGVAGHVFSKMMRGFSDPFGRGGLEQDYSCVTAACMLMRRDLFDRLGGFDETLPVAFNDVDLCIRIRQTGARIIWTPSVEMYHHESFSFGPHDSPQRAAQHRRDVMAIRARWRNVLDADPCYNPNLSLLPRRSFSLAQRPRLPTTQDLVTGLKKISISRTSQSAFHGLEDSIFNYERCDNRRLI